MDPQQVFDDGDDDKDASVKKNGLEEGKDDEIPSQRAITARMSSSASVYIDDDHASVRSTDADDCGSSFRVGKKQQYVR